MDFLKKLNNAIALKDKNFGELKIGSKIVSLFNSRELNSNTYIRFYTINKVEGKVCISSTYDNFEFDKEDFEFMEDETIEEWVDFFTNNPIEIFTILNDFK